MIYLDYAAETPVNPEVLKVFEDTVLKYTANPNSTHKLGKKAKERLDLATARIAELIGVKETEIIYTSGASEANNLAIKGIAEEYKVYGRHIITTQLEHSSVNGPIAYLKEKGFEIDYVNILEDGKVDLKHLEELIRDDTILVSICAIDSEIGLVQDIEKIGEITCKKPNLFFHTDATQAVGKIPINFDKVDLITFAPHKFYGLHGCGVLVKKENVSLSPIVHGGISTTPYRSGTPTLGLVVALEKALELVISNLDDNLAYVHSLNKLLREEIEKSSKFIVNTTKNSSPFIFNFSSTKVKALKIVEYLNERDIYISSKSACCAVNAPSIPVYALTKNRKRAMNTLRVSLSHLTTKEEVHEFIREIKGFEV